MFMLMIERISVFTMNCSNIYLYVHMLMIRKSLSNDASELQANTNIVERRQLFVAPTKFQRLAITQK